MKKKAGDNSLSKYDVFFNLIRNKDEALCPSAELLQLYLNNGLSRKKMKQVEEHIDLCPLCVDIVQQLRSMEVAEKAQEIPASWEEIEEKMDQKFYRALRDLKNTSAGATVRKKKYDFIKAIREQLKTPLFPSRVPVFVTSLAILLVISLYSIAYFNRPAYFYLAQIKSEKTIVLRTATDASLLSKGISLYYSGEYKKAIEKFSSYLGTHPESYTAHYYLGLSYLRLSPTGLPGLTYKFDKAKVNKGVTYLEKALSLSKDNPFYQEDCYWYLGKAYLMLGDIERAKLQFTHVLQLKLTNSTRKQEAAKIISKLERLN